MRDFYNLNKGTLKANFKKDVLDHVINKPFANDPDMRNVMFQEYVKDEHNNSPERYEKYDTIKISNQKPGGGEIQFDPDRRVVPEVNLPAEPDYSVPEPEIAQPDINVPDIITQEEIEEIRKTHPDEAAVMERLIKMSPAYRNQTGPRRGLTEEDKMIMETILAIWPAPDGFDLMKPIGKIPGIIQKLGR